MSVRSWFLLILMTLSISRSGIAASFDCAKAQNKAEQTICRHQALNDADVKMTTSYQILGHLLAMGSRGALYDQQRDWLKRRNQCAAQVSCLSQVYQQQQQYLDRQLQRIYQQGPF